MSTNVLDDATPTVIKDDHYRAQEAAAEAYVYRRATALGWTPAWTDVILNALGLR